MWAQVSLVSPVWLGLHRFQDAGALRPGIRLAAAPPLRNLALGQGKVTGEELTGVPTLFSLFKKKRSTGTRSWPLVGPLTFLSAA